VHSAAAGRSCFVSARTIGEFEERDNPKIRPYTNLAERAYPVILATLFKINLDAGHGGASGRYDDLREIAFDYAWVLERA